MYYFYLRCYLIHMTQNGSLYKKPFSCTTFYLRYDLTFKVSPYQRPYNSGVKRKYCLGSVVVFLDKQIQGNIPGGMQRKRKIPFRVILYIQVYNSINGTIITNPIIIINIILESNRRNHISYYIRYLDLKGWFEILVW